METYQHSVCLNQDKCTGCTTCLRHCPTEAIRIRDGHAVINPDRCIDCGECIRVCPHQAKRAECDTLEDIAKFPWKIALPAPSLYGQFDNLDDIDYILQGLIDLGFDDVYEVAQAAELVSEYTRRFLKTEGIRKPVISSACPAVVRLIALRFPYLMEHIMPLLPPMEIAAIEARKRAKEQHPELKDEDIGVCFISPCPAKTSYVRNGFGTYKSNVDCIVPISELYFLLVSLMDRRKIPEFATHAGVIGLNWAASGGESTAVFNEKYLAADGIENVIKVLDQIENGSMPQLEFIELNACIGGCVGGVMTVENPFIAKARLRSLRRYLPVSQNSLPKNETYIPSEDFFDSVPTYKPMNRLSNNIGESMRMMAAIQDLKKSLPGIDCGSCGAPNCRAFAEDCVKGECNVETCIIRKYLEKKEEESSE